ncbi:MAG: DUF47 family protein [Thermoleophilia bacterium]|nr:DUF47 family protein [Thermoleophilia bacterium]
MLPPMRFSLGSKGPNFYDLFTRHGENAVEAARMARTRFSEWPDSAVPGASLKELERVGDGITHDLVQLLNTHYVTPFDREDIYELATRGDDIVDNVFYASQLLDLYAVDRMNPAAIEQCRVLVAACEEVATALAGLKGRRTSQETLLRIKSLEDEGDTIQRDAIAALFHEPGVDPLFVIRWKDIHEALERAIDACETVAHVIGNILVKAA